MHALPIALLDELLHYFFQMSPLYAVVVKTLTVDSPRTTVPEVEMDTNPTYSLVTAVGQGKEKVEEERRDDVLEDYATAYI